MSKVNADLVYPVKSKDGKVVMAFRHPTGKQDDYEGFGHADVTTKELSVITRKGKDGKRTCYTINEGAIPLITRSGRGSGAVVRAFLEQASQALADGSDLPDAETFTRPAKTE